MNASTRNSRADGKIDPKRIWISWPYHRRSDYLAREFGCAYYHFGSSNQSRLARYARGFADTLRTLFRERPGILFVQNPSLMLTVLAVILRPFFRYVLVNDFHTPYISFSSLGGSIFWKIQKFCIRFSDITIVTNERFRLQLGAGTIMILPDILPRFDIGGTRPLEGEKNILYICTFAQDEPYRNVMGAAGLLGPGTHIYITGNYRKAGIDIEDIPPGVHMTGYLPDADYLELMNSVDAVMVLTEQENCIVCGGYEGLSLSKPLILSGTEALREYFSAGAVYVKHDRESIAAGIKEALGAKESLEKELGALAVRLGEDWREKFEMIEEKIASLGGL